MKAWDPNHQATRELPIIRLFKNFPQHLSVASDPFTELYSHHHSQFENIFIMTERQPTPLSNQ